MKKDYLSLKPYKKAGEFMQTDIILNLDPSPPLSKPKPNVIY